MKITEAIQNAFNTLTGKSSDDKKEVSEKKEEQTPTESSDKKDEDGSKEESDEDEDETKDEEVKETPAEDPEKTKAALQMFETLSNPETAGPFIKFLVEKATKEGLLEEGSSRKEQKEAVTSIIDELKAEVPEENQFLLDALGPALEKFAKKISEGSELKVKELSDKLAKIQSDAQAEIEKKGIMSILDTPKYEPYLPAMHKLMEKFQPSGTTTTEQYIEDIYKLAKQGKEAATSRSKKADKIEKNLSEEMPSSNSNPDNVIVVNAAPTIEDAIKAASQGKKLAFK